MGMMADKDISKVLSLLLPHFDNVRTVTPSNPRAITAAELAQKIKTLGTDAKSFEDTETAYKYAVENISENDVLIVCGSLYLCSDVYNML